MLQRAVVFLLFAGALWAQQTGISGRVMDASNAALAGAVVAVQSPDGTKLETLSNAQGTYQFPALRAGVYVLHFEAPGFGAAEKSISLLVGEVANVDVTMQVAAASSTVAVEAEAPAVDTTSSTVAGDVSPSEVARVPVNGRNYLQLALLVPGITSNAVSNSPLGTTGAGKMQINVDGQQVTQNSASDGFGQPQYSQDAIDQFQIITNRFDATLGRSSRVQVNVQTKSGTNGFHGTLYGFFRNDKFNASDSVAHRVLPFSDQQFGGTFGGPIKKNKLFFFFAYEGERQPTTIFDSPTGFGGLSFTFANELRTNTYLLHADWALSNSSRLSVRATGYTWHTPFNNVTGTASPTRATDSTRTSYATLATWTWTIAPALVNDLRFGLNHFDWQNTPLITSQEYRLPTITVGAPYNYPQQLGQNTYQYRDDLFWLKSGHSMRTGFDYLHSIYSGNFGQNVRGTVLSFSSGVSSVNLASVFPTWNDPSTWNLSLIAPYATSFTQGFGSYLYSMPTNAMAFWVQDDWKLSPRLTFNLGVRYDNDLGIFNPDLTLKSGLKTPHYNDNLLFQPRLGFVWDIRGNRRTVIRGGAGMFYADIQANQSIDDLIFNGQTTISPTVTGSATSPINLTAPFGSVTGAQFLSGAVLVSGQTIQPLGPDVHTPYSVQMSIGAEHQITNTWSLQADFVHWRVYRDWLRTDANLSFNPVTGYPVNPSTGGRPNAAYAGILNFTTPNAAGSLYNGLHVGVQHRFAKNFSVSMAYTLSHLKDSTTGAFYYPNNQFDLASEWAASPDNQTSALTTTGSYALKWGFSLSGSFHYGSGQNFQVTANQNPFNATGVTDRLFTAASAYFGSPANVTSLTIGGANYLLLKRDSLVGHTIARLDLRLSKTFSLKDRVRFTPIVEAFNLLNHSNYGAYQTVANLATFGLPAQSTDLAYAPRMLQFAGRIEF
jgi:hypothetical protein